MKAKSYFTSREWLVIILFVLASVLLNTYLPIKSITDYLGIPGPAAGMALFGGVIFVLWIYLARRIIRKKYSGIITSLLIASICLLLRPWYGVVSPAWFGIYAVIGLLSMGVIVELTERGSFWWGIAGGGLGNLACLVVTWLAIGVHFSIWIPAEVAPFLILGAIISGGIGVLIAREIMRIAPLGRGPL